MNETVKSNKVT